MRRKSVKHRYVAMQGSKVKPSKDTYKTLKEVESVIEKRKGMNPNLFYKVQVKIDDSDWMDVGNTEDYQKIMDGFDDVFYKLDDIFGDYFKAGS